MTPLFLNYSSKLNDLYVVVTPFVIASFRDLVRQENVRIANRPVFTK